MSIFNYVLSLLTGAMLVFGFYYLFAVIFIHKKILIKQFYFVLFCFIGTFYILFELLLSLDFSAQQYLLFHKLKLLCAMLIFPLVLLINFKAYFSEAKLYIVYVLMIITPILIVFVPTDHLNSLPITRLVISWSFTDFIYNLPQTHIVYRIWGSMMIVSGILSLIYYLASKKGGKRKWFLILLSIILIIPLNDLLVGNRIIKNIFLTEFGFFGLIVMIFFDFLWEDRKAYLSVVNLSEELQKHKQELEFTVEDRTRELKSEKEKSEQLLLNVLPEQIATRLKIGESPIADHFDEASVIFIDIVDFTKISAKSTPQKMVNMLNNVFTQFDKVAEKYGLEKIKTIGDCYMAAAGIPHRRSDHAEAVALMAIESMSDLNGFVTDDGHEIQFRVGLDCGPIVAGVIGKQKFIYDLWGDMVNTASRMESSGITGRIQCTERFKDKLGIRSEELGIKLEERGEIEVKGKGMMKTFFIN
jgi:class 3 adenylate cyclase